jgi:hypothetical protein
MSTLSNFLWLLISDWPSVSRWPQEEMWFSSVTHFISLRSSFCVETEELPSLRTVQIRPTRHSSSSLWGHPMGGPTDATCLNTTAMSGQCPLTPWTFSDRWVSSGTSTFTLSQGCPKVFQMRQFYSKCLPAILSHSSWLKSLYLIYKSNWDAQYAIWCRNN